MSYHASNLLGRNDFIHNSTSERINSFIICVRAEAVFFFAMLIKVRLLSGKKPNFSSVKHGRFRVEKSSARWHHVARQQAIEKSKTNTILGPSISICFLEIITVLNVTANYFRLRWVCYL